MPTARIRLGPDSFDGPPPSLFVVDRLPAGSTHWKQVGVWTVREREIEVVVGPGDRLRFAGADSTPAPDDAPEGIMAMVLSDWVEVPLG